jgi:hypothetical protein
MVTLVDTAEDMSSEMESFDLDALIAEIGRYLDAIETFRREGREPCWRDVAMA